MSTQSAWTFSDFVVESNRIEGIVRKPTLAEIRVTTEFVELPVVTIPDLERFVEVCAPGHRLRDREGLNVRVGSYVAPRGGPDIRDSLQSLLDAVNHDRTITPWHAHIAYERLHPFTDGNGRSGRALWLWMHGGEAPIGFLHRFYYETLANDPLRASAKVEAGGADG